MAAKVEEWQQANPSDNFFFRPYQDMQLAENTAMVKKPDPANEDEGDEAIEMKEETQGQTLLFVHQTEWQRRLLRKYGNSLCLLDATYKTTRYALPLFFLVVKSNVDYQVVGSFVTQQETAAVIKEALGILRGWNTDWSPLNFLTENCEQEISAVEETFTGIVWLL